MEINNGNLANSVVLAWLMLAISILERLLQNELNVSPEICETASAQIFISADFYAGENVSIRMQIAVKTFIPPHTSHYKCLLLHT